MFYLLSHTKGEPLLKKQRKTTAGGLLNLQTAMGRGDVLGQEILSWALENPKAKANFALEDTCLWSSSNHNSLKKHTFTSKKVSSSLL